MEKLFCIECKNEITNSNSRKYCCKTCSIKFNKRKYNQSEKGINAIKRYSKKYYDENTIKLRKKRKDYYYKNQEIEKERRRNYYHNHLDKELSEENKTKRKEYKRKYRKKPENKIKMNNYEYNRKKIDLAYRLKNNLRRRLLHAFDKYPNKKIKSSDEYGINYKAIIEHLMKNKPKDFDTKKYVIDHIIPLANFDFNNPEEIKKAFAPENHQFLTMEENSKKWCNQK